MRELTGEIQALQKELWKVRLKRYYAYINSMRQSHVEPSLPKVIKGGNKRGRRTSL
eukprot:CAMPEP_0184031318 /NCGR_PEP_ID=MMETSP0955-20130417/2164_1 /TAXON_ID=627963 /ORGANISM="Aplanochytrium sp, Strain PBS07" /LENGTH=55 /DNA_ID=CAMNT_0026317039 /DNA_START=35 /DNA_END=202 /DNA_ORIENTATION=+